MSTVDTVSVDASAVKGAAGTPDPKPAQDGAERPTWLPEKFRTPEELATSYAELEKKIGQQPQAPQGDPKAQPTDKDQATPSDKADTKPESEGQSKAMDFSAFEDEIVKSGALSDESFTKLESMGIPREIAESYVKGLQLQADQGAQEFYDMAGGKETYGKMIAWAETNLPEAEFKAFLETKYPTMEAAKLATQGLLSRYRAQAEPNLTAGGSGGGHSGYASQAQMLADMAKPEYKKDPAFRAQVDQRIVNSPWFRKSR